MKFLAKYWKVLLALALVLAAGYFYMTKYKVEKQAYEFQMNSLQLQITAMEKKIAENLQYADIQDELEDANAELDASRLDLYEVFPVDMKEEDQIMYVLYLETLFKEEIFFPFNKPATLLQLSDGSNLNVLELVVNYKTTYQGFQDMINYLATDSRVASVQDATIDYNAETDEAVGYVRLWLYLMESNMLEYERPDVAIPEIGKDNIFD